MLCHNYEHDSYDLQNETRVFNRRRSGEVSRMKVSEYTKNTTGAQTISWDDIELSDLEKNFINTFSRVEITRKKGRTVPILLTGIMKKALDRLLVCRSNFNLTRNPHMFCTANDDSYIRGSDVLRNFSELCGAKRPEAIRSTKLRKHVATMTQLLNMKDNDLDILANFMGHDIRVHREYYLLPDEVIQVAKVSKFLIALEQGQLPQYAGKSLDKIPIPQDELEGMPWFFCQLHALS